MRASPMKNHPALKDFLWFFPSALAILAFSTLPYWVGRASATSQLLFRGTHFDTADYSVHIAMMQAGRMGSWTYSMRFTSEPHPAAFIRVFYLVLGHISAWLNLEAETTYHLATWVFGLAALYAIYRLCQQIFQDPKLARRAFLLCAIGGGAGYLQIVFNGFSNNPALPIDFWFTDAYVFFSIAVFPAFSFSLALMATALNLYLASLRTGKWTSILLVAMLAVISQTTNPIAFAVVDVAMAGATFTSWWQDRKLNPHQLAGLAIIALTQVPLLVYNFIILNRDPFWSQFTFQNQILSPSPVYYAWGFAPFWIPAAYGTMQAFRQKRPALLGLVSWVLAGFVLAYLPIYIQRRFLLGITIPLGILAIAGLDHFIKTYAPRFPAIHKYQDSLYFSLLLFASISLMIMSLGSSLVLRGHPGEHFYPRDLENALRWLDANAPPNDFALGEAPTGQIIAQRTRLKTYLGHPMETLHYEDKLDLVTAFYQGHAPPGWLQQTPIHWVIYGPTERVSAPAFQAPAGLEPVYQNETVTIYRLKP